ncbi:MAG: cupin domain-containing protein [Pigmentiphaga sp.]|nr:cupin domain-containing protein [Pigmentiphaga sp.]
MLHTSLLTDLPDARAQEVFTPLCQLPGSRIERIVSQGQSSPAGFWYDQDWDEWVLVLQGQARLELEGRPEPYLLGPGDALHLPAHCRHRVAWTTPDSPTVWLAVHADAGPALPRGS